MPSSGRSRRPALVLTGPRCSSAALFFCASLLDFELDEERLAVDRRYYSSRGEQPKGVELLGRAVRRRARLEVRDETFADDLRKAGVDNRTAAFLDQWSSDPGYSIVQRNGHDRSRRQRGRPLPPRSAPGPMPNFT